MCAQRRILSPCAVLHGALKCLQATCRHSYNHGVLHDKIWDQMGSRGGHLRTRRSDYLKCPSSSSLCLVLSCRVTSRRVASRRDVSPVTPRIQHLSPCASFLVSPYRSIIIFALLPRLSVSSCCSSLIPACVVEVLRFHGSIIGDRVRPFGSFYTHGAFRTDV